MDRRQSAFASENYAITRLRCRPIVTERQLQEKFMGQRVPEGIFKRNGEIVTIEVKRIPGNELPYETSKKRCIKLSDSNRKAAPRHIRWPWTSTVKTALSKLQPDIAANYNVCKHTAVFLIPTSLPAKAKKRTIQHITTVADGFLSSHTSKSFKVEWCILETPDEFFDRLCL